MLKFIIGVFVGAIIGFSTCIFCVLVRADENADSQCAKNIGDDDAGNK